MQKTKNKPFKPSSVPIAVMIIIAILTLAFVLVSGVYLWYFTKIVDPIQQLAQSQQALQQEVQEIKGKTVATKDVVVAEEEVEREVVKEFIYDDGDNNFDVVKEEFDLLKVFLPSALASQSRECGTNKEEGYFVRLLNDFSKEDNVVTYTFKYGKTSQKPSDWSVTIIPNDLGYKTLDEFKDDFDFCAAGGDMYPSKVSKNYLMFTSGCGTGFSDGSDRPIGCSVVSKIIEPTIRLK